MHTYIRTLYIHILYIHMYIYICMYVYAHTHTHAHISRRSILIYAYSRETESSNFLICVRRKYGQEVRARFAIEFVRDVLLIAASLDDDYTATSPLRYSLVRYPFDYLVTHFSINIKL